MTPSLPFPDADSRAEPAWLAARRRADVRARAGAMALVHRLERRLAPGPAHGIDIGAGTGANCAYLTQRIAVHTCWSVLDHDQDLLNHPAHADALHRLSGIAELPELLDRQGSGRNFLTCSAVLDVLRDCDVEALTHVITSRRMPALFSLSVTGDVAIHPEDPLDHRITDAFNAHQRRAGRLGPDAVGCVGGLLPAGWLQQAETPWQLQALTDADVLRRYLTERAEVAIAQDPDLAEAATEWLERRLSHLVAGQLTVEVGHVDQLILPPD